MKKEYLYIFILFTLLSCKRDNSVFEGPSLEDQYGDFGIVQPLIVSKPVVNLTDEPQVFYGEFTINVNWKIKITGLTSGAVGNLSGKSKVIDGSVATWNGGASSFPSFGLEKCAVEMTVPDRMNDTIKDTFEITGLKLDNNINLVYDFESGKDSTITEWSQATVAQVINCSDGNAAKGDCYYSIGGIVGWDWGIGNIVFTKPNGFGLSSSATSEFFNIAVKGINYPGTSIVQISFAEDDNEDGIFDDATEDSYVYQYNVINGNWNLVSIQYSSLSQDADGNSVQTNGNNLLEPHKLYSINVFQLADPNAGEVTTYIDHIVFTNGGPYEP